MLWFDLIGLLPLLMIGVHLHALKKMISDYKESPIHEYSHKHKRDLPVKDVSDELS
jgi:hypothetical protein